MTARINLNDTAESRDAEGELIIRRRSRFNGKSSYRGKFEYPADARRRFKGNLNYSGIYSVVANSFDKFNGFERYGGRRNSDYFEYVTDLDGNPKLDNVSYLEKIPIATRNRLGFVIAGYNLNIDDSGKISLPKRFTTQSLTEIESGRLKTLFRNKRA